MFSEYLLTNIFIFKPCLMFRVSEVIFFFLEITNKRLCKYMVIAHKTIKYSLTKN